MPFLLPVSLPEVPPGHPEIPAPAADILLEANPAFLLLPDSFPELFPVAFSMLQSLPGDVSVLLIASAAAPDDFCIFPAAVPHP